MSAERYLKAKKNSYSKLFVNIFDKKIGKNEEASGSEFVSKFDKFKDDKGKSSTPLANDERRIFFKCKGYDHILKDCPNNRIMTLRDIQEIDDDYVRGNFKEDEHDGEKNMKMRLLMR